MKTPAQIAAIEARRGVPRPPGLMERVRLLNIGKKRSVESIERIRKSQIERCSKEGFVHISKSDPTWVQKVKDGKKNGKVGGLNTPELRRRHSELLSGRKAKPEHVEKRVAPMRDRPQTAMLTKRGLSNHMCKEWAFRSPTNMVYRFINLSEFIRNNENLFNPVDVNWKRGSGTRSILCRAVKGMTEVNRGRIGSWKGWTKFSEEEKFYNDGRDLLDRQISNPIAQ